MPLRDAGWLPDPTKKHQFRYWTGTAWTEHVADGGVGGTDELPVELLSPATVREWNERRRGAYWGGLFDKPLERDWVLWLAGIAIAAGLYDAYQRYEFFNPQSGEREFQFEIGFVLDAAFALAFQFLIFGLVPALIRRTVRNRRATAPSPASASMAAIPTDPGTPTALPTAEEGAERESRAPRSRVPRPGFIVGIAVVAVFTLGVGVLLVTQEGDDAITIRGTVSVTEWEYEGGGRCRTDQDLYVSEARKITIVAASPLDRHGSTSPSREKCRIKFRINEVPAHAVYDFWLDEDEDGVLDVYWRLRADEVDEPFRLLR